ncbi:hypothetical protein OG500_04630 [Kitasatospora sp. NBC_01250]|uniref:hypothetical protein n=1 Tax=Kitasatospora sp. NBC_01250 TaxID=2903571 RepID=UPI002E341A18|nr:hypothetical protein [Kitasatospora sp. NBC_01250]
MTLAAEVLPTLADIGAGRLPEPPEANDGNPWAAGDYWLYCGRTSVRVLWLGPVTAAGGITAGLLACADCISTLHGKAVAAMAKRDSRRTEPTHRAWHVDMAAVRARFARRDRVTNPDAHQNGIHLAA